MKPPATAVAPSATPIRDVLQPQDVPATPQATAVGQTVGDAVGIAQALPLAQAPAAPSPADLAEPVAKTPVEATPPPPSTEDVDPAGATDRSIGVGQVICWQLALVAVGLATTSNRLVLGLTTAAAILTIIATSVRFRGSWLYSWAAVLAAFGCRRRRADLSADSGSGLVSLFCGRTTTGRLTIREQTFGLLSRSDAAGVALRLGSGAHQELFCRLSTLLDAAEEQPVDVTAQLILHTGVRQDRSVRAWLAVTARRTPAICTDDQLGQVLANTVRRMVRRFDRDHLEAVALDESDLLASVAALAHANAGRGHLREAWSTWSAGPVRQVCVRLNGFAGLPVATAQSLADTLLGTVTGCAQTLAVTVTAPGPTRYDAVLRVAAAHPTTLDSALTVLAALARSYGVQPERLDGRHADGVAATLPLGVCLP